MASKRTSEQIRMEAAFHEAGHATAAYLLRVPASTCR
jgi:hypothetical protein